MQREVPRNYYWRLNLFIKQLKYKTMYEVLEHWKEYQKKKKELEKLDKLIVKLVTKNGVTKY